MIIYQNTKGGFIDDVRNGNIADKIEKDSNIMDIAMKTIDIMGSKISEEGLKTSDYVLNVYTDKVGLLDIEKLDKCYEYGYQSVIKNLDAIKKALG